MITADEFKKYVIMQYSGQYNMITQAIMVMDMTGLDASTYGKIQIDYGRLRNKYPEEFEEGKQLGLKLNKEMSK